MLRTPSSLRAPLCEKKAHYQAAELFAFYLHQETRDYPPNQRQLRSNM